MAAAVGAGGRIADDSHAPGWWTLASPDNHGIDIAAWPDFEDNDHELRSPGSGLKPTAIGTTDRLVSSWDTAEEEYALPEMACEGK